MTTYNNNSESVGNTPLVRLNRIFSSANTNILVKMESRNPTFSVKCRIGAAMINDAIASGELTPDMTIVEPTSGNTGIGLAYTAAILGYPLVLFMPESMSIERRKVLKALGAKLELTPAPEGMNGAIKGATELLNSAPDKYYIPQQFENPSNPRIHEKTTGKEIWKDTAGEIDVFVAGVGTGGTLTGVSRYIKQQKGKKIHVVAVEPAESPVISQKMAGEELKPGPHRIQGIGAGFIPSNLDLSLVDEAMQITSNEAITMAKRLSAEEGMLVGISSGAAVAAALKIAERPEFKGKNIVTVLPDGGERYLSTVLFEDMEG
ncbi:MAG: cysteine synthase A [Fibrobacter sp.]|nr:cysteine synthase A [Fibrobacter sp.]